jgi:heme/copper-type cytochrome/quinol oxidase subunit 3
LLPLVNTIVLLSSGVSIIAAHRSLIAGYKAVAINSLYITIFFGILFS